MPCQVENIVHLRNREVQGVALPQKEQVGQVGQSSHHGTYHRQPFDGAVQL